MKINRAIIILMILGCNTVFYAQTKGFDLISAAHMTQSQRGTQTVGLPVSTTQIKTNSHFYGFEQSLLSTDISIETDEFILKIYPNPFNELFTVDHSSNISSYKLKVFTLDQIELPTEVFQAETKLTVRLNSNQTGVFLAFITINGNTFIKKIIRKAYY